MGRKVYDDPNNPYGLDFIVFGNSFFVGHGDTIGDGTDLDNYFFGTGIYGHPTTVSVSQDRDELVRLRHRDHSFSAKRLSLGRSQSFVDGRADESEQAAESIGLHQ